MRAYVGLRTSGVPVAPAEGRSPDSRGNVASATTTEDIDEIISGSRTSSGPCRPLERDNEAVLADPRSSSTRTAHCEAMRKGEAGGPDAVGGGGYYTLFARRSSARGAGQTPPTTSSGVLFRTSAPAGSWRSTRSALGDRPHRNLLGLREQARAEVLPR